VKLSRNKRTTLSHALCVELPPASELRAAHELHTKP